MRTSFIIASLIAAPVLLITACGPNATTPTKGTVIDKEYEAAKKKTTHTAITRQACTTTRVKGKSKRTCTSAPTGRYKTTTVTTRHECYEVDIRLSDGNVTEICDRGAYYALRIGDHYSSAVNYSAKTVKR